MTTPNISKPISPISSDVPYFDLGSSDRPTITTRSRHAQVWFNRGLIWCYGFNHEEACECFLQAIAHDSSCAMAYWGLAYALGPNYNKPWEIFDERELGDVVSRTHHAAAEAKKHVKFAMPVEKALIEALGERYPAERPGGDWKVWNLGYAQKMGEVYRAFPGDLDVAALYADSLMNLSPWSLWDLKTGKPREYAKTLETKEVLERSLALPGGLHHPGILHYYIHLMEMSKTPEAALAVADNLRGLVPDAGHLHHMPTHLDILCGDYRRAIASNTDAIVADNKYFSRHGPLKFYTIYRCHDLHFRIYAAMFAGQSRVALETIDMLEAALPEELLRVDSPPMADWLESFIGMRVHVLIRFGRWNDILRLEFPKDQAFYCVTTALTHYAKGVAYAAAGRIEEAFIQRRLFQSACKRVLPTRTLFNNRCLDILAIASAMLDGELEYRRGNYNVAFAYLLRSIKLDDALPYDEPWGWMQPTRHAYGALLLEQGHVEEAAKVYSADLGIDDALPRPHQHPNNVWSLHGYYECLMKLGREAEAKVLRPQLKLALATADVPVKASCFCRLKTDELNERGDKRDVKCCSGKL